MAKAEAVPRADTGARDYRYIDVGNLIESRQNPRKAFDSLEDLKTSISKHGIITPLLVRPVGNNGKFEVLAGARRLRAAQELKLATLPCRVVEAENDEALELVVVDNLQRENLHPLDEAEGFSQVLDLSGGDVAGLCAKVGKKASYVTKRLVLLSLADFGKKAYLDGKVGHDVAMQIARLQVKDQKEALQYAIESSASAARVRDWIEGYVLMDLSRTPFDRTSVDLLKKAGSCVACPKRTGSSKDLFDDIKSGDHCTDRECYRDKMRAHIDQLQKSLEGAGHKVYGLWELYHSDKPPKGVLNTGEWLEIKDKVLKCDLMAKGVFLDGSRSGRYADICPSPKNCKIHASEGLHGKTPAEREKTRKENLKTRTEKAFRARVLGAVYSKVADLDLEGAKILAVHCFDRLWHQSRTSLVRALGWDLPKHKQFSGYDFGPVEKRIRSFATVQDVMKFLVAVACSPELDPSVSKTESLAYFAAENQIDCKAIRASVEEEFEKKARRVPKALPKRKGKKGK